MPDWLSAERDGTNSVGPGTGDHGCRAVLQKAWDAIQFPGADPVEITISTAPPLVLTGWTEGYKCPHGTTYYIEPTGDQRAKWIAEGTP